MRLSGRSKIAALAATGTASVVLTMSPASGAVYWLGTTIDHGNAGIAVATGQAQAGLWTFTARTQGPATTLFLQLYHPTSPNRCFDKSGQVQSLRYDNPAPTITATITSPYSGLHCIRVILWGSAGAATQVTVSDPGPSTG